MTVMNPVKCVENVFCRIHIREAKKLCLSDF